MSMSVYRCGGAGRQQEERCGKVFDHITAHLDYSSKLNSAEALERGLSGALAAVV